MGRLYRMFDLAFISLCFLTSSLINPNEALHLPKNNFSNYIADYYDYEVMYDHYNYYPYHDVTGENNSSDDVTIRVCCDVTEIYDIYGSKGCHPSGKVFRPTFHYENGTEIIAETINYSTAIGFPSCQSYTLAPEEFPEEKFYILPTGHLMTKHRRIGWENYCLLSTLDALEAYVCFEDEAKHSVFPIRLLYAVSLIIGAIFLLATFLVYLLIRELRDHQGLCVMACVLSLFFAEISAAINHLGSHVIPAGLCYTLGIMMQYWFLTAFMWMNIISFNVCKTLRNRSSHKSIFGSMTFAIIYACGIPCIISVITILRDHTELFDNSSLPKPYIGLIHCWFIDQWPLMVFFYIPFGIIISMNIIFFCISIAKLCSINASSDAARFQFGLYLKLFIWMGITWIFEFISYISPIYLSHWIFGYVWVIFDLINLLQGVAIFFVLVWRDRVRVRLSEIFCGVEFAKRRFPDFYGNENECSPTEIKDTSLINMNDIPEGNDFLPARL